MYQNQPNPYFNETEIPFELKQNADAFLEIWDLSGKKLAEFNKQGLNAGRHTFHLDMISLGLAGYTYVYQLRVENVNGVFRQARVMTAL